MSKRYNCLLKFSTNADTSNIQESQLESSSNFYFAKKAANIFLMQTLGEFHQLKSNMLEKQKSIIGGIKEDGSEEKTCNILRGFMRNEVRTSPISFSPNVYHNT